MRVPEPNTREQHSREKLTDSTDLTDAEGVAIGPRLPPACSTGRPRSWWMRDVVNGKPYVLRGGVAWRLRPKDLPPKSTVCGCFSAWHDTGPFAPLDHHLVMLDCEPVGREAPPDAAALDSRSVKTIESRGSRRRREAQAPSPPLHRIVSELQ